MDRDELARTLVAARGRLQPSDVGVPAGTRRRVPGLRREEVALLAGISVDYLIRLEQGRGPKPSASVMAAIARALRLSDDERDLVFLLAGSEPPRTGRIDHVVRASTQRLMARFNDLPAMVLDAMGTFIAWNDLAAALLGDFSALAPAARNVNRMRFLGSQSTGRVVHDTPEEARAAASEAVADLRAVVARYPDDPDLADLLGDLHAGSELFGELWAEGRVEMRRSSRKTFAHPDLGRLTLECDVLLIPDTDQRMVVYSAEPSTPAAEALALLRVIGTQDLRSAR